MNPALTPKLVVSSASAAIEFYQRAFGAKLLEHYATPDGRVVHSALEINTAVVAVVDEAQEWGNVSAQSLNGSPVLLVLELDDPDRVCRAAVAAGASVVVEIDDRFYGRREGRICDPFGHYWILSRELQRLDSQQIQRGVDEFGSSD